MDEATHDEREASQPIGGASARGAVPAEGSDRGADPWATFDRWASNVLLLLALLGGLAILLVAGASSDVPPAAWMLTAGAVVFSIGILGAVMVGLRDHASWARPAAEALLWATLAMGVLQVIADLSAGRITFPIGAIIAVAVLWKRPSERARPAGHDRRGAWLVGVAYVIATLPGPVSPLFAHPPAFLLAQQQDLVLDAIAHCGDPDGTTPREGGPAIRLTWRLAKDDVLPGGEEAIEIGWDSAAPVELDLDRLVTPEPMTRNPSGRGAIALDRAFGGDGVAGMDDSFGADWARLRVGIPGNTPLAHEGTLVVRYRWQDGRGPEPFDLYVRWAHDDHWVTRVPVVCTPPAGAGTG